MKEAKNKDSSQKGSDVNLLFVLVTVAKQRLLLVGQVSIGHMSSGLGVSGHSVPIRWYHWNNALQAKKLRHRQVEPACLATAFMFSADVNKAAVAERIAGSP